MRIDYQMLGKRIKIKRNELGLSQEKLAELASLSIPHMSHVETGKTKISLPALVAVANALHVSMDELLCDSVYRSKEVFQSEIAVVLKDCDELEIRMIAEVISAVKNSYRNTRRFE